MLKKAIPLLFKMLIAFTLASCTNALDYQPPQLENPEVEIKANTDIQALVSQYEQSGKEIHTFPGGSGSIVEAVVVSSDEGGNFYKNLVLQDTGIDEVRGLVLMIDLRSSYTRYPYGHKIFLKAEGLSMYRDDGGYRMGYMDRDGLIPIPESVLGEHITRSGAVERPIVPSLEAGQLNDERLNTRIRVKEAQFESEDLGKTYAGEPYDSYNALRPLHLCRQEAPLYLSSSVYSDFKSEILPVTSFDVEGILSRDFDGRMVLVINSPEDLSLKEARSCSREYFTCGMEEEGKEDSEEALPDKVIFYEDFERIGSTREIEAAGWLNVNMHFGSGKFVKRSSNDNGFLRISAYGTQEPVLDAWLVSPPIDLDASSDEVLSFDSRATFNRGRLLTLWFTNDFDMDPREAHWRQLQARVSEGSADGSNERFVNSGSVPIDCIQGTVRLAFRYLGGDPAPSTNYDLDNVLILGRTES